MTAKDDNYGKPAHERHVATDTHPIKDKTSELKAEANAGAPATPQPGDPVPVPLPADPLNDPNSIERSALRDTVKAAMDALNEAVIKMSRIGDRI